ncbi:MAG TPA: FAD-dependent oxidoreductase [Planctomycetota bacterium]|nr:FAD-dependent oxidoreductase [Planctomycetota bacterium]
MMTYVHLPSTKEEASTWNFPLGISGFRFADLNRVRRLMALDALFLEEIAQQDPALVERLKELRATAENGALSANYTETLIAAGRQLGSFIAKIFHIDEAVEELDSRALADQVILECRKKFMERRVWKPEPSETEIAALDLNALEGAYRLIVDEIVPDGSLATDPEREFAHVALALEKQAERAAAGARAGMSKKFEPVVAWGRALSFHPVVKKRARKWVLLVRPEKMDYENLVERKFDSGNNPTLFHGPDETRRNRDGFDLTDKRFSERQALGEMHYCLICHPRGKDSCSCGLNAADGKIQKNPLGISLDGCPLDEKISEAHLLKREGHAIAALAMVMIDNPLCAGTGHRICNDCMKSCIFQKQTPVNIPQAETRILTDVLNLPYGFEIYSLLTRWNPLNVRRPYPLPYNGKKILVVGMGPAGYTLAHYLLNEGFGVVGIEGLKVEPLSKRMRGAKRRVPLPIKDINEVTGPLDQRVILGFGGVSEYGITVRWDKNFLDINYIVLMRRKKFRLYSGVRFGGTLTIEDCWRLGFDHIALATGAGRPTLASVKNNLVRGVRAASDFLMGLQGTGIYRKTSLGNLQVQLPAIVIGGGLTAIDTATELQAYYIVQVEKTLERYERIAAKLGEAQIRAKFDVEEAGTLDTWIRHGRAVRTERAAAAAAGRAPDFNRLIREWGGVTIAYRKRLQDSPAYRLNHEEVVKALEEGIGFADCLNPVEFIPGESGAVSAVKFELQKVENGKWSSTGQFVTMPAKAVMVAAGTHPNATYEREYPGTFAMDDAKEFYRGHKLVDAGEGWKLEPVKSRGEVGFFTSYQKDGKLISFYGDNHPTYAGNVVKAMASAKHGHKEVARAFSKDIVQLAPAEQSDRELDWVRFAEVIDDEIKATVVDVVRLTKNIVEVVVHAPLAARNFQPGQFYRLQNFENYAERAAGFLLAMEGIALTGAWVDKQRGLLSMIVLEMGGSSRICALLEPGEDVVVMGPTGTPTEIPENETVLLAGGGLGNAVLFSIAAALKTKNNRVLYFAGYKHADDLFKRNEVERACDLVVWSTDTAPQIPPRRPQDRSFVGTIVQAMEAYTTGKLGPITIPISEVQRIITIGSNNMMDAVKTARRTTLACELPESAKAIGSINSPMQCMMKEICAQCLQRHVDPATGKESFVFSCFNQDQELDAVDFKNLSARLRQNSTAEKLTSLWIDYLFASRMVQEA